jgi:hypothetical protein
MKAAPSASPRTGVRAAALALIGVLVASSLFATTIHDHALQGCVRVADGGCGAAGATGQPPWDESSSRSASSGESEASAPKVCPACLLLRVLSTHAYASTSRLSAAHCEDRHEARRERVVGRESRDLPVARGPPIA